MTNSVQMDALTALLDERRRYEGWLAQVDARRDAAPSHVVERVRSDYAARLKGVTEQLRGRASELESTAADLAGRIARLMEQETARRDERAETELRAAVGELPEDAAHSALASCDEQISVIMGERTSLGAELAQVQNILGQVMASPPPARPEPVQQAAPEVRPAPEPRPAQPAAPAAGTPAFDELAFLNSVVKPKEAQPAPSFSAPVPMEEPRAATHQDYLPPPTLGGVRRSPDEGREQGGAVRAPSATPDSMASFFKDVPTEQVKTLKCQECGTMNYPTEWYCERCGGELAAL
ncbi:MAG: Ran-binding zinc finger domain-containing protein [Gemmatimonadaceae bacterium]